jgi:hypothetical protein
MPRRRVRVVAAVALAGAAVVVAGCSDDGDATATGSAAPTVTQTVTVTASPTPSSAATASASATGDVAAFVAVVRAQLPEVAADRGDDEIGQLAVQACAALAEGRPADDVVAQMQSLGTLDAEATDQATARELVKLAIDTVCLDQADRVDEF